MKDGPREKASETVESTPLGAETAAGCSVSFSVRRFSVISRSDPTVTGFPANCSKAVRV